MKNFSFSHFCKPFMPLSLLVCLGVAAKTSQAQPAPPVPHASYNVQSSYVKPDNGKVVSLTTETSVEVSYSGYGHVSSDWNYDVYARAIVFKVNASNNTLAFAAVGPEDYQHLDPIETPNKTAHMYSADSQELGVGTYKTVFGISATLTDVPAGTDPYMTEDPVQIVNDFTIGRVQ